MATYTKFQAFVQQQFINGSVVDWDAATVKVALTNTAPNASTDDFFNDITELAAGNGYTAGGITTTITPSYSAGVFKVVGSDVTWTATGSMGPFRYVVLYISTGTSTTSPLVAYWDRGTSLTLATGETFTVDFDATNGIFTAS